jgi:hypothetical protein
MLRALQSYVARLELSMDTKADTTTPQVEDGVQGKTIEDWTRNEDISAASFYKLKRLGLGPYELRLPGTNIVRIIESSGHWRQRMLEVSATKSAKLATSRRREQTKAAAQRSIASEQHIRHQRRRAAIGKV